VDTSQRNTLLAQQGNLETQIQQAQAQANSAAVTPKVLTSATFATKTGIGTGEIIALGAGAGLAVGLVLAYLFEYVDDSIRTPEDAEKELGGPAPLRVIPAGWSTEPVRAAGLPAFRETNDPSAEYRSVHGDG
jgi:hypothetical protein